MANILGAEISLPSWEFFGGSAGITISVILFLLFILIAGGVAIWLMMQWRVWNRKIVVFENVGGQKSFTPTYKDKARLIKLGDGGEEILYLKKKKVYRTAYGKKMGKNTYWFAVGQDGYWYNFVLGDLDAKMGMLDIEPIDRDMRYMHVAIRKNIAERYKKQKFLEKYGTILFSGVFLIIMIIGIWFLLDKIADISTGMSAAISTAEKVNTASENILSSLNNLCGGSGLKPAG